MSHQPKYECHLVLFRRMDASGFWANLSPVEYGPWGYSFSFVKHNPSGKSEGIAYSSNGISPEFLPSFLAGCELAYKSVITLKWGTANAGLAELNGGQIQEGMNTKEGLELLSRLTERQIPLRLAEKRYEKLQQIIKESTPKKPVQLVHTSSKSKDDYFD